MLYTNLPGLQVFKNDGGLVAARIPRDKSVLVVGTAGKGQADTVFQVQEPAAAAQEYGFEGTLVKAMEEVRVYSDNILLYRMGTKPGKVTGVGKDTTPGTPVPGFDIELTNYRAADAGAKYRVYYSAGVLYVFKNQVLVYANDTDANRVIDTNDVLVTGEASATEGSTGLAIGTAKTWEGAIALEALADLVPAATEPLPVYTEPVTGLNMSLRETYVAQELAFELLEIYPVQVVVVPNAIFDAPNVAFYAPADPLNPTAAELKHRPSANVDALDWLNTSTDAQGNKVFHWHSEATDSAGTNVPPVALASAADRIGKDYREVNFGYQLSRFCAKQSAVQKGQGVCVGFIGCAAPKSFKLTDVRAWIGSLPEYDSAGKATVAGRGLLGNAYAAGCPSDKLNALCADADTGRSMGFFENVAWEYDGGASTDENANPINIGAYIHVMADWARFSNGYGRYVGNVANLIAGFFSRLDAKSSILNKTIIGIEQLHRPATSQLDALAKIGINMLVFKEAGQPPSILHGYTMGGVGKTDYDRLTRQSITGLVVSTIAKTADPFIGESTNDGLQLVALKTALDRVFIENLKKRGYIGKYTLQIYTTPAEQRLGKATIKVTFQPADELVQLKAVIGLGRL